jgi:hypothetical protein
MEWNGINGWMDGWMDLVGLSHMGGGGGGGGGEGYFITRVNLFVLQEAS